MKIKSLGCWASYGLKGNKHFSLIIEHNGHKVWIDPAVKYTEPVDYILISSPDTDHWLYLKNYIEKYPDTPIYSTRAVLNIMKLILPDANWKYSETPLRIDGKEIKLISIPEMVGKPAVAFKIGSGEDAVVIIPEFDRLGKREKLLMKNTIWIVGVGEYEKRRSNDHKATLKELIELAKELKPKKIYITNYRTSLMRHRSKIIRDLSDWNGEILTDGAEIEVEVKSIDIKTDGIYLVKPHAKLIWDGLKTMIVKSRKFDIANKKLIVCDNDYAYGVIELSDPIVIKDRKEFFLLAREHLITDEELKEWDWEFPLYGWRIVNIEPFQIPRRIKLPPGIQTFVKEIEKYYITEKLNLPKFRSEGVDYDLAHPEERWKELIADLRYLGNSAYPRLKNGEKWGEWTLDDVLKYFAKIVDALRSVYFPIIPPSSQIYKEYTGNDPDEAKESSYWQCYAEAEKYMKSSPPKTIEEAKEWDKKRSEIIKKATVKPKYYSIAKPYYRGYFQELSDELKSIGWDKEKLLIDTKWDGLRLTVGKAGGKGFAYVDPEGLKKKSPNISDRIPAIIKEIEDTLPDNTVLDCEFLAKHPQKNEMLHRTVANAILNSKMSGKELEDLAIIFAFDILFFGGEDLRDYPLHERLEYLSRIKSTKHIWVEKVSTKFPYNADAFVIDGSQIDKIEKIAEFIREAKNGRPKFCAEGIMIKRLDWPYEAKQNHGWMKVKFYHEIDLRVISKKLVKGTKDVYNYYLGYDTPKDFVMAYLSVGTKDWYGKLYAIKDGKVIAEGKDVANHLDDGSIIVTKMGKTDNAKELSPVNVGDILRIAAEEVLRFENPNDPKYPRYSFYIGRVLEPIPEKNISDSIETIDKLASLEPQRISVEDIRHIRETIDVKAKISRDKICEWINKGEIPDEEYDKLVVENQPLPPELYIKPSDGIAWAQMHIRGLDPDDTKKYNDGKISFAKLIEGHSIHVDLRMKFEDAPFVQWVITQDAIPDYFDTLIGRIDPKTGNASKGLAIVKPSAEEPKEDVKAKDDELIIGHDDAKLIEKYVLFDKSYIIPAGDVGATSYKDAYMCAIWIGKVKAGVQRPDLHEYFLYPDDSLPNINKELFNGRFIIRCFRANNAKRWWVWKAYDNPYPMDSIKHADIGHYWPIKAEEVTQFGHTSYADESRSLFKKKYRC